tara:strand:+ start:3924 stop:4631 length:708 start_codon:yes stop_codon:yes gene_type:complete
MKTLILLALLLSGAPEASDIVNSKDNFLYYGNGVSFLIPDNWIENIDINDVTQKTLKHYIDESSGSVISRLENNKSRLFHLMLNDPVGIIVFEEWAGSVEYSDSLAETFYTITSKFLVDAGYNDINLSNLLSQTKMVDGVRSAHLELICIKNGKNFFYKSTLIPIGSRFLHTYSLSSDQVKDLVRINYETFLKSFIGARVNDLSSENVGILFQVLVICGILFILRLLKFLSSKKE